MSAFNKITVNGKEYNSIEDVPKEFKVMFEDKDNNGIPDFVEGILAGENDLKNSAVHTSGNSGINANFTSFIYNGRQYSDINQLPPEAKQLVERNLSNLAKTGMKIAAGFTNQFTNQQAPQTGNTQTLVNSNPTTKDVMQDSDAQLNPGFKFRLVMTAILFILAVIYIIWLTKLI
jgi:hypothetical protein